MAESKNPLHRIEDIKRKLYERGFSSEAHHKEGVLHAIPHDVPNTWQEPEKVEIKNTHVSIAKKFFIGAVLFFIGAIFFGIYMYMNGTRTVSSDNIEINILGNAFTQGGEELSLQVEIINHNNASLELSNMVIEYPKGASTSDIDTPDSIIRLPKEDIGTIPAGGRVEKSKKVTLYGDQNTIRNVKVKLEYHPEGSNAIFTKEKSYPVTISSSPITLSVDGPIQTSSGQEITLNITTTLNTTLPEGDTMLSVSYPNGFKPSETFPKPVFGNSVWNLNSLAVGKPVVITVKGTLNGQDGDEKAFHVYVGTTKGINKSIIDVVYNSLLHTVELHKPFLQATILLDGADLDSYSTSGGKMIRGQVVWTNNLPSSILDAEINVQFSGNIFDKENVVPEQGFYDSANNRIVWNRNTNSEFSNLAPGATGYVNFEFTPMAVIGSSQTIRDPQIILEVSIKGREATSGSALSEINNFSKKIVRIASDFQLAARANYASGELPPTAEKETIYTIYWTLSNSVNPVTQAEARAELPIYTEWMGVANGNKEVITYDPLTRQVVWNIGTVRANTGFGSNNREAIFNIKIKPSISQVGTVPNIIKEVSLTGIDSFSNSALRSVKQALSTRLENDPFFKFGDEKVIR